ncbi:MAG: DUF3782 domain-containing protein [Candidatus Methylumidiphilus sp.]
MVLHPSNLDSGGPCRNDGLFQQCWGWGDASEASFHDTLKGMLEDSYGVEVQNSTEHDDEGMVFGRPDQVELDIINLHGLLILCELQFSIGKCDIYFFERKVKFYEKHHHCTIDRRIAVGLLIEENAREFAKALNIEIFGYFGDIGGLFSD